MDDAVALSAVCIVPAAAGVMRMADLTGNEYVPQLCTSGYTERRSREVRDQEIIELYWKRDEGAVRETRDKYGAYCYSIADNILHDRQDSEECVNDTWMHAWNAIPPQRPQYLRQFLSKITRNISFDRYQAKRAAKRGGGELDVVLDELEECVAGAGDVETEVFGMELHKSLNEFVRSLPSRESDIFLRRYFFVESTAAIAERYHMKESNVLTILSRTRKKLRSYLIKEGFVL